MFSCRYNLQSTQLSSDALSKIVPICSNSYPGLKASQTTTWYIIWTCEENAGISYRFIPQLSTISFRSDWILRVRAWYISSGPVRFLTFQMNLLFTYINNLQLGILHAFSLNLSFLQTVRLQYLNAQSKEMPHSFILYLLFFHRIKHQPTRKWWARNSRWDY